MKTSTTSSSAYRSEVSLTWSDVFSKTTNIAVPSLTQLFQVPTWNSCCYFKPDLIQWFNALLELLQMSYKYSKFNKHSNFKLLLFQAGLESMRYLGCQSTVRDLGNFCKPLERGSTYFLPLGVSIKQKFLSLVILFILSFYH